MWDNFKKNMFGNATDEEINQWLNSREHEFWIMGIKNGLANGFCLGIFIGVGIGLILCMAIFK